MPAIIVKSYEHFNRSMPNWNTPNGVYVKNKDHYDRLMKENGMVSHETMQRQAESKKLKEYKLSKESEDLIRYAKQVKDKKGNVKLSGKAVDMLVKKRAIGQKIPSYMKLPSHYQK